MMYILFLNVPHVEILDITLETFPINILYYPLAVASLIVI